MSWRVWELDLREKPTSSNNSLKCSSQLNGVPLFKNARTTFSLKTLVDVGDVSPLGWFLSSNTVSASAMSFSFMDIFACFSLLALCFLLDTWVFKFDFFRETSPLQDRQKRTLPLTTFGVSFLKSSQRSLAEIFGSYWGFDTFAFARLSLSREITRTGCSNWAYLKLRLPAFLEWHWNHYHLQQK